jgi:hypothetical protein
MKMMSIEGLALRPDRIVGMLMYADRTERPDYGEATGRLVGSGPDAGPEPYQHGHDFSGYTIEELEALEQFQRITLIESKGTALAA